LRQAGLPEGHALSKCSCFSSSVNSGCDFFFEPIFFLDLVEVIGVGLGA
jgi:hypothetical protein